MQPVLNLYWVNNHSLYLNNTSEKQLANVKKKQIQIHKLCGPQIGLRIQFYLPTINNKTEQFCLFPKFVKKNCHSSCQKISNFLQIYFYSEDPEPITICCIKAYHTKTVLTEHKDVLQIVTAEPHLSSITNKGQWQVQHRPDSSEGTSLRVKLQTEVYIGPAFKVIYISSHKDALKCQGRWTKNSPIKNIQLDLLCVLKWSLLCC